MDENSFVKRYQTPDEVVNQLASVKLPVEATVRAPQVNFESRNGAVECSRPDPRAYAAALAIVGGEVSLLRANPDGSVTILNRPRY